MYPASACALPELLSIVESDAPSRVLLAVAIGRIVLAARAHMGRTEDVRDPAASVLRVAASLRSRLTALLIAQPADLKQIALVVLGTLFADDDEVIASLTASLADQTKMIRLLKRTTRSRDVAEELLNDVEERAAPA